ncbi:MAG: protein kinase [Labilithrix sp.]|nr:protein kinase [Labilithrix sp.]
MSSPTAERKRPTDPLVGTLINGKFKIEKAIARGGMGRIYYGTQAPLDRPVAVKVVKADTVNEEESQFLKRFLLEASILAKLQHPNVVTLFDYGRIENAPNGHEMYFIAMEYLDGVTLSERIRDLGSLTAAETLTLFRQMARGLREAHARGVVHRDLKPSNIIIVPEADGGEIVKIVDFGIGKVEREGQDLTRDGILVGTPKYMAPEQFDGSASPASDIYALGTIIYQLLVGEVPFAGSTMAEFMMAKLQKPIPPMREVNPVCESTELLENLVYGMLARSPADRPTLDEVFQQLAYCEEEVFGSNGARLLSTGSRPVATAPSSSSRSVGALKVPYTIVAPQPLLSNTPSSGVSSITGFTGMTPRPMATSARPPAPSTKRAFPLLALVGLLLGFVIVGAAGAFALRSRATATNVPPEPQPTAPALTVTSFVLHLDSEPSGAAVSEKGAVLGSTPIDIKIERESVGAQPRSFQIKKDGFTNVIYAQNDSEVRVEQVVTLAPEPAHPVKSPAHAGGKPAGNTGGRSTGGDSEIRLKR